MRKESHTDYYLISNDTVQSLSESPDFLQYSNDQSVILPFPVTTYENAGNVETVIDLSALNEMGKNVKINQIAVADTILETIGYNKEELSTLPNSEKIKMISGEEIGGIVTIVEVLASSSDTTSHTVNTVKSTLTYTLSSKNRYYVTNNVTTAQSGGLKYVQSIAVQNFAIESGTSSVTYAYHKTDLSTGKKTFYDGKYNENSSNYDSLGGASGGSGVAYTYNMPKNGSTYVYEGVSYYLACYAYNSSVQPGGRFNIYGNMALVTGGISFSVSFPWGISVGEGNPNVTHCKTQLTATLNA